MPRRSPGARAKGIGASLRRLREAADLPMRAVCDTLDMDKSKLSRLETGQQNPTLEDVAALLAIYGVTGDDRDQLLEAVRSVDEPGWWEKTTGVTKESAALADYETEARELISWAPTLIPGLLQTMDYAAAVMELYGISQDDIGRRLGVRRERQRAIAGKAYTAYLSEAALAAEFGGRRVMEAQLGALLERADVNIRVVPERAAHLGSIGAFLMLRFPEAPTVVHCEMLTTGAFHDTPELTGLYEDAVAQIEAVAMSETQSVQAIQTARKELKG